MNGKIRYWSDLDRWVPGGPPALAASFPLVPLGELLRPRREIVSTTEFRNCVPVTIHFDGSIDARDRTAPFKGPMFAAHPGDVVFSKIDVRNGAIAIVPERFAKVVVTSEYPVHVPDTKQVDARYLALLLRSPNFLHLLKSAASGTSGRKRVDADSFDALEIPLPDRDEQKALLDVYERGRLAAEALELESKRVERRGLQEFESALGLTPPASLPRRLLQISRYRDIDRWSHEAILDKRLLAIAGEAPDRYPLVALADVVADLENGWSPQCLGRPAQIGEWGVLKLGAVSFGQYDELQNKALPARLKPQENIEVKVGDVLISRANILRLVGACTLVRTTRAKLMLCDKIFRVVSLRRSPIDPEFLAEVIKLPTVRQQIEAAATGTSPTMKNISKPSLLDLTFPLPQGVDGMKTQVRLVAELRAARESAASLRQEARQLKAAALSEVLNTVFH
jgi:type I restriction enzyme S subunit